MLETIVVVTLITLVIAAPVIALAVNKAVGETDKTLEHQDRISLRS